ncbi:hypothetical protein H6P81_019461 [Aristolochia fimbriata]|uniref:Uncharacterized protein n=1 Tax=Aristolochia fimbriata TaxID=158543 RepID=A0AAV7DSX0_ARIFI|nr:hypothetical protein H6P81_019461 [Aristolochia fimbriata]
MPEQVINFPLYYVQRSEGLKRCRRQRFLTVSFDHGYHCAARGAVEEQCKFLEALVCKLVYHLAASRADSNNGMRVKESKHSLAGGSMTKACSSFLPSFGGRRVLAEIAAEDTETVVQAMMTTRINLQAVAAALSMRVFLKNYFLLLATCSAGRTCCSWGLNEREVFVLGVLQSVSIDLSQVLKSSNYSR